jgi:hypothetical protein
MQQVTTTRPQQPVPARRPGAPGPCRRYTWGGCIIATALIVVIGRAQPGFPVFSVQDLERAMKSVGRNIGLAHRASAAGDFETAKMRVARVREGLFPTVVFWRNRKETDAVTFLKQAITALDELDVILSNTPVAAAAAGDAAARVDSACQRCHAVYREQDAASKGFSLKERR